MYTLEGNIPRKIFFIVTTDKILSFLFENHKKSTSLSFRDKTHKSDRENRGKEPKRDLEVVLFLIFLWDKVKQFFATLVTELTLNVSYGNGDSILQVLCPLRIML